jgi:TATA-binding protein-associated factor Taf7
MRLFAAILDQVDRLTKKDDDTKRTTLTGIEIAENQEHKLIVDEVTFNKEGGLPKGHPFIDREWKGALKVTEDSIEKPIDLTKDMNEEELTTYVEREWNRGKYQAGKK